MPDEERGKEQTFETSLHKIVRVDLVSGTSRETVVGRLSTTGYVTIHTNHRARRPRSRYLSICRGRAQAEERRRASRISSRPFPETLHRSCFDYYHRSRTHLSLDKDAPEPRELDHYDRRTRHDPEGELRVDSWCRDALVDSLMSPFADLDSAGRHCSPLRGRAIVRSCCSGARFDDDI
jgi:hypothetical protein